VTSSPGDSRPFACLWCGQTWQPRTADSLEAHARLCPGCLGRAGENPFLRHRLRVALEARAAAGPGPAWRAAGSPLAGGPVVSVSAPPAEVDDWYLRRGAHARGAVHDIAWQMELDAATTWLDGCPLHGEIVELAAGTGWWSALLATKGELHAYDEAGSNLDRARERLTAHRLRAHLHVREPWAPPDRVVDAVVVPLFLGSVPSGRRADFLVLLRAWLRPGGFAALISVLGDPAVGVIPAAPPLAAGAGELAAELAAAGFASVEVRATGRFFLLASGTAA